jgi:hypothetical protein
MIRLSASCLTLILLATLPAFAESPVVTPGLDLRLRWEDLAHDQWGQGGDHYIYERAMPSLSVQGDGFRLFTQLIGAGVTGMRADPGPPDRSGFDLLQASLAVDLVQAGPVALSASGGRELLGLGSERLVGRRFGANVPQPFDGGRLILSGKGWKAQALWERPIITGPDDFDDEPGQGRFLRGLYATLDGQHGVMDAYLLATGQGIAPYAQGAGRERRRTAGIRLAGKQGPWSWNWEAMAQWGHWADSSIHAWSLASETGYALAEMPLSPRLLLRANIASGDNDPADGRLGTFNPLYPRAKYFGELTPIGPRNMMNLHPGLELDLGHGVDLSLAGLFYWRENRHDGVYSLPGQLLRPADPDAGRYIGHQGEIVLGWEGKGFSVSASLSAFKPGPYLRRTGTDDVTTLVGVEVGWAL